MIVEVENVERQHTSCNFCNKGILNASGYGLIYPYKTVLTFVREGNGLKAAICTECLDELMRERIKLYSQ